MLNFSDGFLLLLLNLVEKCMIAARNRFASLLVCISFSFHLVGKWLDLSNDALFNNTLASFSIV